MIIIFIRYISSSAHILLREKLVKTAWSQEFLASAGIPDNNTRTCTQMCLWRWDESVQFTLVVSCSSCESCDKCLRTLLTSSFLEQKESKLNAYVETTRKIFFRLMFGTVYIFSCIKYSCMITLIYVIVIWIYPHLCKLLTYISIIFSIVVTL